MFSNWRKKLWKNKVESLCRRQGCLRHPSDLDQVEEMAFYYRFCGEKDYRELHAFLKRMAGKGKHIWLLVYCPKAYRKECSRCRTEEPGSRSDASVEEYLLEDKDLSFSYFPKRRFRAASAFFGKKKFELLVDLSPEFHYVDVSVMATVCSCFKVGKSDEWSLKVNDFCLGVSGKGSYREEFIGVFSRYVPLLRTGASEEQNKNTENIW